MPELITIPIAYFEFEAGFVRPDFKLWMDRASIVQSIFDALGAWQPKIDDVDAKTDGKASEQGVTIKLPMKRVSFFFGPASCKFSRENVDWQSADETITILDTAVSALTRSSGIEIATKKAIIAMHLQPKAGSVSFLDLLSPFVPSKLAALDSEPLKTMAAITKWRDHRVELDGSGAVANAIFVRLDREFASNVTSQEIAGALRQDQSDLFNALGVEEDRS